VVADTTQPRLVWEVPYYYPAYYFPVEDVRTDLLVPTATVSHSPRRGDAQHFTVKAGSREAEDAALRYVDSPIEELRDVASSMIPAEDLGGGYLAVRDERGRVSGAVGGRFHRRVRSAEAGEQRVAGLFAALAHLSADPAVLVHAGVSLALVPTGPAGHRTCLEHRAGDFGVIAGVTGQHLAGGKADVRAVEVAADALAQLRDHLLRQARVGAGRTGLGAVETRLDALDEKLAVDPAKVSRIGIEHLRCVDHVALPSAPTRVPTRAAYARVVERYPLGAID
jgi:hypothetical protein